MSTVELSVSASIGDYYNLLLGREWKEFITQQHSSVERLPVRVKNFRSFSLTFCGYLGQAFVISERLENRSFFFLLISEEAKEARNSEIGCVYSCTLPGRNVTDFKVTSLLLR